VIEKVSVQRGFSDEARVSAAKLYDSAFGAKLSVAIPNASSRIAVLAQGFDPGFAFVAIRANDLVGIAGFKGAQGSFTGGITFQLLRRNLGLFRVMRAALVLTLFERKQIDEQLLMDGIAVSPNMRGNGIGTRLLQSLIEYAELEGYRSVRLDVIDMNSAARRLYERVGFVPIKTEHFPYLKWLLHFGASTQMEYRLLNERQQ